MRIVFESGDPVEIMHKVSDRLVGRKLGSMVKLDMKGDDLLITIKKLGTSTLEFKRQKSDMLEWKLSTERLAMAHRPFKDDVIERLTRVVQQVGGDILT